MSITVDDQTAVTLLQLLLNRQATSPTDNATLAAILVVGQENRKLLQTLIEKVDTMSQTTSTTDADFKVELAGLQADMAAQTTVGNSVLVFVHGLSDQLAKALASAQTAGATADELAAIKAVHASLIANTSLFQNAMSTNTTSQGETATPVETTTTIPTPDPTTPDVPVAGTTGDDTGTAQVES